MTVIQDFVMTERFYQYYSGNPESTLDRAADHCSTQWENFLSDSEDAYFYTQTNDRLDLEFNRYSEQPLSDRLDEAVEWFNDDGPYWWDSTDAVIILDHADQEGHQGWVSTIGSAIYCDDRVGIVDYAYEGDLSWSPIDNISFHELIHLYNGEHRDAAIFANDKATVMSSWNDIGAVEYGCYNDGTNGKDERVDRPAYCTEYKVDGHIN
ncbi:hypothetical protein ACFQO4_19470 [Saliphagus sp. GCM10025334]|uniref:hypothetical protein n=1 Tax=Natronosalvus caseinilyticus TaxID=2953747 RepID=UPI0028B0DF2E|nr:hypothetical protein [Natronosalvus caseinilyticus]